MKMKSLLSAGLGALALGLVATAAQAAPAGLAGAIDPSAGRSGLAEKVTWYGDRHYGRYHRPYYEHRWYRARLRCGQYERWIGNRCVDVRTLGSSQP